jgi:predicted lipoprotein with Yx(FWY)xxD motif
MRCPLLALAALAVTALVAVGCGGGGGSKSTGSQSTPKKTTSATGGGSKSAGYQSTPKTTSSAASGATIDVRKTVLGTILVDSTGRTLYLFEKDKSGKSSCSGACASAWPPVTTTAKPTSATAVHAALLGTTKRSDGSTEVTYNGQPLYTYAGDAAPGDTTGEGLKQFGAEWYVLSPQGKKVEKNGS